METRPPDPLAHKENATELKAAIEARRELGSDLEDHILEGFLARLQQRIDIQVSDQLSRGGGKQPEVRRATSPLPGWVLPASLAVSIPMLAIAGAFAGLLGIVAVMAGLVILTIAWLENSKH